MMNPLAGLEDAVVALRAAWSGRRGDAGGGESDGRGGITFAAGGLAAPIGSVRDLGRVRLVAVTEALGVLGRRLDAVRAQVAAEVERECRPELGADSLAKQQGFRNASVLLAATTGISTGEAFRLTKVGKAVEPRTTLTGEAMPAKHPHLARAVHAGNIGAAAAGLIVSVLDRMASRATPERLDRAEQLLAEQAPGLTLDQLRRVIDRVEGWVDPDGLEPVERQRRDDRELYLTERDGMLEVRGRLDAASGAPLKVAIEAMVTARMRATNEDAGAGDPAERVSVPQLQADALVELAEHALGCDNGGLPLEGATVVVRMNLETLTEGTGIGEIDGVSRPISASAARERAASGTVIPVVLGGASEVLDWGKARRGFTRAQKLALVERDGGCAMCGLPPGMTHVHHLKWWARDAGPTDLANGILLCTSCHHRIHDNGWDIRIDGGASRRSKVWFIPPPTVDPARTPRLGGRARFLPDQPGVAA